LTQISNQDFSIWDSLKNRVVYSGWQKSQTIVKWIFIWMLSWFLIVSKLSTCGLVEEPISSWKQTQLRNVISLLPTWKTETQQMFRSVNLTHVMSHCYLRVCSQSGRKKSQLNGSSLIHIPQESLLLKQKDKNTWRNLLQRKKSHLLYLKLVSLLIYKLWRHHSQKVCQQALKKCTYLMLSSRKCSRHRKINSEQWNSGNSRKWRRRLDSSERL